MTNNVPFNEAFLWMKANPTKYARVIISDKSYRSYYRINAENDWRVSSEPYGVGDCIDNMPTVLLERIWEVQP